MAHPQRKPQPNDPVCWCGAWFSEHAKDGTCKYNNEDPNSCVCDKPEKP